MYTLQLNMNKDGHVSDLSIIDLSKEILHCCAARFKREVTAPTPPPSHTPRGHRPARVPVQRLRVAG